LLHFKTISQHKTFNSITNTLKCLSSVSSHHTYAHSQVSYPNNYIMQPTLYYFAVIYHYIIKKIKVSQNSYNYKYLLGTMKSVFKTLRL